MQFRRRWVRLTPELQARRGFERLVLRAVASLPLEIRRRMENLDIVVEDEPGPEVLAEARLPAGETLYGFYRGIPLHQRGSWYTMSLPDKISIFRRPILADCQTAGDIRRLVRSTVIHEIAHHFGMTDEQIRKLERTGGYEAD